VRVKSIDIHQQKGERFRVLATTERTQLGVMTLPAGQASNNPEGHPTADNVTYVVEGRVEVHIGDESKELRAGEVVVIPSGTPHRIRAVGRRPATVFQVFGPPAYPAEESETEEAVVVEATPAP
jgi:mannose-6-phosphate isomerase-like protein (cupin superfamily)